MLTYIAKIDEIPIELVEEAWHLLLELGENEQLKLDSLPKEVVRFLETCATEKKLWYTDPVVEQMKHHTLLPYSYEQIDDTGT